MSHLLYDAPLYNILPKQLPLIGLYILFFFLHVTFSFLYDASLYYEVGFMCIVQ